MAKQKPPARDIPHNVEAEEAVLGSILIDHDALSRIPFLQAGDFYVQKNAWIYEAVQMLHDRREPVDFVTLGDELERREQLAEVGGVVYISHLINAVPSAIHIQAYAAIVANASFRRRLIGTASKIAQVAYQEDLPTDEAADQVDGIVTATLDKGRRQEARSAFDVARAVFDEAEKYSRDPLKQGEVRGIDTGWPDLNRALGGWRPGLYVILGVPHLGKTWFVLHAAAAAAKEGRRVLHFSLEMTAEQLVKRLCMSHARVSREEYERGVMTADQWQMFTERATEIAESWDIVFDDVSTTLREITAAIHREHRQRALDLVVIDYLGLIECPRSENRNLQIGGVTRKLKNLSRAVGVPILIPHQISDKLVDSRGDKRPMASDGYESGHIHQDVDVLLGLYRDDKYNHDTDRHNIMDVLVLKDRLGGGAGNAVQLFFDHRGRLLTAETRQQPVGFDDKEPWYNR